MVLWPEPVDGNWYWPKLERGWRGDSGTRRSRPAMGYFIHSPDISGPNHMGKCWFWESISGKLWQEHESSESLWQWCFGNVRPHQANRVERAHCNASCSAGVQIQLQWQFIPSIGEFPDFWILWQLASLCLGSKFLYCLMNVGLLHGLSLWLGMFAGITSCSSHSNYSVCNAQAWRLCSASERHQLSAALDPWCKLCQHQIFEYIWLLSCRRGLWCRQAGQPDTVECLEQWPEPVDGIWLGPEHERIWHGDSGAWYATSYFIHSPDISGRCHMERCRLWEGISGELWQCWNHQSGKSILHECFGDLRPHQAKRMAWPHNHASCSAGVPIQLRFIPTIGNSLEKPPYFHHVNCDDKHTLYFAYFSCHSSWKNGLAESNYQGSRRFNCNMCPAIWWQVLAILALMLSCLHNTSRGNTHACMHASCFMFLHLWCAEHVCTDTHRNTYTHDYPAWSASGTKTIHIQG